MKKGKKKGLKIVVTVVAVVAVAAVAGVFLLRGRAGASAETTYTTVTIGTGDLQKSVTGTGTLDYAQTLQETYPFDVTLSDIQVEAGQSVSEGDVLATVDTAALGDTISSLTSQISSLDQNITRQKKSESETQTVKAPTAGRVKIIYAQQDDNAQDIMAQNGALLMLSLDGKMKVTLEDAGLALGQEITLSDGTDTYDGLVESVEGTTALITFTDDGPTVGQEMTVLVDEQQVGTALAQINMPLAVTAQEGVVSKVYVSENQSVSANKSLFYLIDKPTSLTYATLVTQREQAVDALNQAWTLKNTGVITAQANGIVAQINATAGNPVMADEGWLTMYAGDTLQMVVGIDELDINNVSVGQEATVELDALEDETYTAQVTDISQVGTASGGVTTYSVTLQMDAADGMKLGMNGTATIVVEQRTDVVLVPLLALQSSKDGQYVWLSGQGEDGDPGIKTLVTTGMSNDTYAEVLSGLSAGDEVVVVRTASSSSTTGGMFGGMSGISGVGGGFTGGGDFSGSDCPSGDFGGGTRSGTSTQRSSGGGQ